MNIKPGTQSSEFKLNVASMVASLIISLLMMYGIINESDAPAWTVVLMSIFAAILPAISGLSVREYTKGRSAIKFAAYNRLPEESYTTIHPSGDDEPVQPAPGNIFEPPTQ